MDYKEDKEERKFQLVREIEDVERFVKLVWDLITENCYLDALWYIVGTLTVCSRMMFDNKKKIWKRCVDTRVLN